MTDYYTIISENSVLKAENDRLRLIAESKRAERAHECLIALYACNGINKDTANKEAAEMAVLQAVWLETALAEQAKRERLGLGKQAEMENGNG